MAVILTLKLKYKMGSLDKKHKMQPEHCIHDMRVLVASYNSKFTSWKMYIYKCKTYCI